MALSPQACDIEMIHIHSAKDIGRLTFNMEFSQIKDVFLTLQDLKCKLDGLREDSFFSYFTIKTGKDSIQSHESEGTVGVFDKIKNRTKFLWENGADLF
jgi:hypothetical protein